MHDVARHHDANSVRSKDAQKQWAPSLEANLHKIYSADHNFGGVCWKALKLGTHSVLSAQRLCHVTSEGWLTVKILE